MLPELHAPGSVHFHRHNAVYFKSDARAHTLCYFEGDPKDQAVAFEVASEAELEQAAATLDAMQRAVRLKCTSLATPASPTRCVILHRDIAGTVQGYLARMSVLIHEQGARRTIYYPDDKHLRQYDASGPTLISVQIWPDAATAENAFRSGLVIWENDPQAPPAPVIL